MKIFLLINLCFILFACSIGLSEQQSGSNQISCDAARVGAIPHVDCQPSGGGARGR
jgi:hypothetical protein